jgi:hypothetical protein
MFWFWDQKIKTLKQLIDYNQNTQKEKLYFSFLPKDKQEQIKRKFKLKRILK